MATMEISRTKINSAQIVGRAPSSRKTQSWPFSGLVSVNFQSFSGYVFFLCDRFRACPTYSGWACASSTNESCWLRSALQIRMGMSGDIMTLTSTNAQHRMARMQENFKLRIC